MTLQTLPTPAAAQPSAAAIDDAAATPLPEISSTQLLGEQGLLRIAHRGAVYTLRATSKGGLILTK